MTGHVFIISVEPDDANWKELIDKFPNIPIDNIIRHNIEWCMTEKGWSKDKFSIDTVDDEVRDAIIAAFK